VLHELQFTLCGECQAKYAALRFDPRATYVLNTIPLCSLMWTDEHPDRDFAIWRHTSCRNSIIRLAAARTQLWRNGAVPEESRGLWEEARRLLPEWPGFDRLVLDVEQMQSLEACVAETEDFMSTAASYFPAVTKTDEGGGVIRFSATRDPSSRNRKWWHFWK
jgi:hypothetical protein